MSLFSAQSYCSSTVNSSGTCVTTNTSSPSVYFAINNTTISKQYSILNSTYGTAPNNVNVLAGQQIEVNGICNTGGTAANMLSYSVYDTNNVQYVADIYGVPYVSSPTQTVVGTTSVAAAPTLCPASAVGVTSCQRVGFCENGHFHITVTPPAPTGSGSTYNLSANAPQVCSNCLATTVAVLPNTATFTVTIQLWTGNTMATLAQGPTFSNSFVVQY